MKFEVLIRLKAGVLDVEGKAVQHGLRGIGFEDAADLRVGKLVEVELPTDDFDQGYGTVSEMCEKLLVNPIIEEYEIRSAKG